MTSGEVRIHSVYGNSLHNLDRCRNRDGQADRNVGGAEAVASSALMEIRLVGCAHAAVHQLLDWGLTRRCHGVGRYPTTPKCLEQIERRCEARQPRLYELILRQKQAALRVEHRQQITDTFLVANFGQTQRPSRLFYSLLLRRFEPRATLGVAELTTLQRGATAML